MISIGDTQIEVTTLHLIPFRMFKITPGGRRYDHILYRGLTLKSKRIVSGARTDHYPVIAACEVR